MNPSELSPNFHFISLSTPLISENLLSPIDNKAPTKMAQIQLAHGRGSILMLLLSSCSSCAFLVPPSARAHTRHAQVGHAVVQSVRMEAKTIMEMPMPNELADWGALAATAHPPAHPHLYVV